MGEKLTVLAGKKIKYSGLFSLRGLYNAVFNFLDERGYGPFDAENAEEVYEDGKQIFITIKGDKKISDGAKVEWETKMTFTHCQETIVEQDGKQTRLHKGNFNMDTLVLLATNYDQSFQQRAYLYFLRVLLDKYVFQSYLKRAQSAAKADYSALEAEVKNYLNMEKYN